MFKSIITGNVGAVKFIKRESANSTEDYTVLSFTLASTSSTRAGKTVTNWVTCKVWGTRAEALHPHLCKGQTVLVEGRPEARAYMGATGPKADLVIHIDKLEFIGRKPEGMKLTNELELELEGASRTPAYETETAINYKGE